MGEWLGVLRDRPTRRKTGNTFFYAKDFARQCAALRQDALSFETLDHVEQS